MNRPHSSIARIAWPVLVVCLAGSMFALHTIDNSRGPEATLQDVLYLPSSKVLKRLSLGYSGLLADIYWTRAVQYFGSRHIRHATHYDTLYPLLDIATDLDPHIIVAYEFGSIFLSQDPPEGAGQPDKAVALIEKGIRENPTYWRLYFSLGFVHYVDRHDPAAAEKAFLKGSEIPGALPWMKVMAARMAEHSNNPTTALALWQTIYQTTADKDVRYTAELHLRSVKADIDITRLKREVQAYRNQTGSLPASWADLVRARLLPGIPVDPTGQPYKLYPDGSVNVADPSSFRYLGEWQGNEERLF